MGIDERVSALGYPLALLSGVLLALSFPRFGHPAFAWVALVPLLVALSGWQGRPGRLPGQPPHRALTMGLLTGVELVDGDGRPAPDHTRAVVNGMRARGVLVGTTGRAGNVLKVRPPLVFGLEHIPLVLDALEGALGRS